MEIIDISKYIEKEDIILDIKIKNNKKKVLSFLLDHLIKRKKIKKEEKEELLRVLLQREEMGSTAIGGGIALPHARVNFIKNIILCIGIFKRGVRFDSLDGDLVNVVALLISNHKETGTHLKILACLARMLRDKYFLKQLKEVKTQEEAVSIIKKQISLLR